MENLNWHTFKKLLQEVGTVSRYLQITHDYTIFCVTEDGLVYAKCHLVEGTDDFIDFETNFKTGMVGTNCD